MVNVSYPIIIVLIPIIIIVWYIFFREKIGVILPNSISAKHLKTPKKIWLLWFLRLIMITSLACIIMQPTIQQRIIIKKQIPQDIMIVFDISLSMLAEDIHPNRMEVAKDILQNFIASRSTDRIWLIIFAWKPFVTIPFSSDYRGISHMISWLSPYLIRQDLRGLAGTNIWDAILLANMSYSGSVSAKKSIIFLTDGRANIGIDPIISATESAENNIQIYPVGIGSLKWGDLFYTDSNGQKNYFYDASGIVLKSDFDEPMMRKIAEISHGQYFHWDNRVQLEKVFSDIDKNLPIQTEEKTELRSIDTTFIFILLFILCVGIDRLYLQFLMKKYQLA